MKKILAIDDNPEVLQLIGNFFTEQNMKVITTTMGSKALNYAVREEPDVILLDIKMPDIDGMNILQVLKKKPTTSFIPVIMLTGESSSDSQIKGLVAGAEDYVTKPFDLNVLYARVQNVIRHSEKLTRFKHDQFNLLRYLLEIYSNRNYEIYTKLLTDYPDHPAGWTGLAPDLIIQKKQRVRCFQFESTQSLLEEALLDRWRSLLNSAKLYNPSAEINIIVRTKQNLKIAQKIAFENSLIINIRLIKRRERRKE